MEEPVLTQDVEKGSLFKGIDVTKFKIYSGPFPVIQPKKELSKKEIDEFLKPKKKT